MDPRLTALAAQQRLRQLVELNGRVVGMTRTATDRFVVVRPYTLTDLDFLVGKHFYWIEQRFVIRRVEPIVEESWRTLEARIAAETDLRKKQALRGTLDQLRAKGPVFLRLTAVYDGGAPP